MKTSILFWIPLLLATTSWSQAQRFDWVIHGASLGVTEATSVVTDGKGRVYVGGYFDRTLTVGDLVISGPGDDTRSFLATCSESGNVIRLQTSDWPYREEIWDIALDQSHENIYVAGYRVPPEYTPGPVYISKMDTSSQVQWITTISSKQGARAGYMAFDPEGNILYNASALDSSMVNGIMYPQGYYLMKLDPDGKVLWNKTTLNDVPLFQIIPCGITTDAKGSIYVIGEVQNATVRLDSIHSVSAGSIVQMFVTKYDSGGNIAWVRQSNSTGNTYGESLGVDAEGNVYAAGYFKNDMVFGSTFLQCPNRAALYVVKIDSDGTPLMAIQAGDFTGAWDINVMADGSFYLAGTTGPNSLIGSQLFKEGGVFVAKYSADGNCDFITSAYPLGDPLENHVNVRSLAVGNEGQIYIAGKFKGSCMFEPFQIDDEGKGGMFFAKVHEQTTSIIRTETFAPGHFGLNANYPNPFNPSTTISFDIPTAGFTTLDIYDSYGRLISRLFEDQLLAGHHLMDWNAENLPSGVYYCKLQFSGRIDTRKLILLR